MTCPNYETMLEAYLDGELPPAEVEQLHRHLEACPECRRELAELRRGIELFRAGSLAEPEIALPPGFAERVAAKAVRPRPGRIWTKWMAAAAAVLLVAGIGLGYSAHLNFFSSPEVAATVKMDSISLQSPTMGVEIAGDRFELHSRSGKGKASVDLKI
jgi:anti-sigma factor RsiW